MVTTLRVVDGVVVTVTPSVVRVTETVHCVDGITDPTTAVLDVLTTAPIVGATVIDVDVDDDSQALPWKFTVGLLLRATVNCVVGVTDTVICDDGVVVTLATDEGVVVTLPLKTG